MIEKLRRDNLPFGILLGFLVPAILFGIIFGIIAIIEIYLNRNGIVTIDKILLLSVVPNVFILRHYLLKLKYDLTGRGIMISTFVIAIVFAIMAFN